MEDKILINSGPSKRGWHRIENWLHCKRLFAYRHILAIEVPTAMALVRGSLVHVGVAHHHARLREAQRNGEPDRYWEPEVAVEMVARTFGRMGADLVGAVHTILRAHFAAQQHVAPVEVLHVEEPFEVQLGEDNIVFTQRYDRVVRAAGGGVCIVDTKTAANTKDLSKLLDSYSLSGQFLMAQRIGRAHWGEQFSGVALEFVGSVPPYRTTVAPVLSAPQAVADAVETVCCAEAEIADYAAREVPPRKYPGSFSDNACNGKYGRCAYYENCRFGG